jgi:hypothetical protein
MSNIFKAKKITRILFIFQLATSIIFPIEVSAQQEEGLYFEVHIDWMIEFKPEKPHIEIEVTNYDFYDLNVEKIQIDNKTVFEGNFLIKNNDISEIVIDDISEIFDLKNENITYQVYVEGAKFQPSYEAKIRLDYNITEGNRIGYHRSYGAFIILEHNVSSQLPSWLGANKEIDYNYIYTNQTGAFNYIIRTAIVKYFEDNSTILFAVQKEGQDGVDTEAVRMSAHYPLLVNWLNPSHIEIIKEKPTSFLNHLYNYQGEETITIPFGEFETYHIKRTQPYFVDGSEGEIWVEKNTGLILKSNNSFLGLTSEKRTLIHTNILKYKRGRGIPGYHLITLLFGVLVFILMNKNNNSINSISKLDLSRYYLFDFR